METNKNKLFVFNNNYIDKRYHRFCFKSNLWRFFILLVLNPADLQLFIKPGFFPKFFRFFIPL